MTFSARNTLRDAVADGIADSLADVAFRLHADYIAESSTTTTTPASCLDELINVIKAAAAVKVRQRVRKMV